MFLFLVLVGFGATVYVVIRNRRPVWLWPPKTKDDHYAKALSELMERKIDQGVFARAVADSNGSEAAARTLYVRYRARALAAQAAELEDQIRSEQAAKARRAASQAAFDAQRRAEEQLKRHEEFERRFPHVRELRYDYQRLFSAHSTGKDIVAEYRTLLKRQAAKRRRRWVWVLASVGIIAGVHAARVHDSQRERQGQIPSAPAQRSAREARAATSLPAASEPGRGASMSGIQDDHVHLTDAVQPGDGDRHLQIGLEAYFSNDLAAATKSFESAASAGNATAQGLLGAIFASGKLGERDISQAVHWFKRAAEQGEPMAQFNLAQFYKNGDGVDQSDAEAVNWYRRAAEAGDHRAQYELAMAYMNGDGVQINSAAAIRWLKASAERGNPYAQTRLGNFHSMGLGVPRDDELAVKWLRSAAEQGFADACLNLGTMYASGRGVPEDPGKAANWYRKAAEAGHPTAQVYLGGRYETGEGVARDPEEALRWYRLAAEQGEPMGQFKLGMASARAGDPNEAVEWWRLAGKRGEGNSQFNLGSIYARGEDVPKDLVEAYAWFYLAHSNSIADAEENLRLLEREMTTLEVADAIQLANRYAEER